ncbi:hypothetical protein [Pseudoduganella umbonata]|uniref:PH domain-containing protein n=1 Tax=Pseudoduganella umbonata TaxID=864828 RepID=A0A4P8HRC9_9BURK|nr:hypothetical protein [Pseudoduganella umbonata]MBB3222167.1 hypothetical protein [Pseudoduganella umbonata]QCP12399.1 hypothetical protein FCL38_19725 [Pseudoduganella umbonata]
MERHKETDLSAATHGIPLCRKAWTAYIPPFLMAVIMVFVLRLAFNHSQLAAAGVLAASTLLIGYRVLLIRSVQLYYDDTGVWLYSGVLPWQRGVRGIKWRDLDGASYVQSFRSWLLRSWKVRVSHRFTDANDIVLSDMARGREAVTLINERHQQALRDDRLA